MTLRTATILSILLLSSSISAVAQSRPDVALGKALIEKNCAGCHAIGLSDRSKHPAAPAFARIFKQYPASILAEALAEGLSTGHPDMPEFTFGPRETAAIIRYLESISE